MASIELNKLAQILQQYHGDKMISIIMLVIMIATFLTVFYFTYASKIEGEVVEEQVDYIVKDFASNLDLLPDEARIALRTAFSLIKRPDMNKIDEDVAEHNKKIITKAAKVIITSIIIGGILIIGGLYLLNNHNWINVFNQLKTIGSINIIILLFIALTEFMFLNIVGKKYIAADPNFIKLTLIDNLVKKLNISNNN